MIGIVIPTYNRADIVTQCIKALARNIHCNEDFHVYVGIDGTDGTLDVLLNAFGDHAFDTWLHVVVNSHNMGYGANVNNLIQLIGMTEADIMMQMDDDHILTKPLWLDEHIAVLRTVKDAGWIRLMGIGAHNYVADLRGCYWFVRWNSPELYIPSNRPHIKRLDFHQHFGLYPERLKLGQTEEAWCHQCIDKARTSGDHPYVLVPLNSESETAWQHIGRSWQELDK